jgi:ornithine cyclodeaminase
VAQTWNWAQIAPVVANIDLVSTMEAAFVAYSAGRAVIPPVGELNFDQPPGDVHLKYGYILGGDHYVVKIASGFYDNPKLGLSSSNGLMLLFDQRTGQPVAILLDEGKLTDLRTAAAGAVAAKHMGPASVRAVGVVGAGIQARMQLQALEPITSCRNAWVWARRADAAVDYAAQMSKRGWSVQVASDVPTLLSQCNLVVTTTPSEAALVEGRHIRPGTHITAMGSDTPTKRELDSATLIRADRVVADSRSQCATRGEICRASQGGFDASTVVELGDVIAGRSPGRSSDDEITVVDLTGVAVQDLAIAQAVTRALNSRA